MRPLTSVGRDLTVDWGTSTAIPGPRPPGPPTITIYSPENRLYPAGYDVHAIYICESATSFVISCEGDVPFGSLLDMDTTGRRTFTVRATDLDGRTSTKTATFEVFDWRAPTVVVHTPAAGVEYGLGESVLADYECFDEQGGSGIELCDGDLKRGQPVFMTQVGSFTSHFWAVDRAHNVTFASVTYTVVDRTPPPPPPPPTTITIESPQEGAIYVLGEAALARFDCQYAVWCRGSVPSGLQLDTWSVGAKTFTVRAGVHGGNDVIMSRSYRVVYPFSGFSSPLALFPGFVTLKAGTKVPAKFSLGGDFGLGVVTGSKWTRVSCATGTPFGDSSPTDAGGKLSFPSGRYQLLVVTNASWAGSCRQLAVALDDGTTHLANVTFD
jgi:hypothetical protein